MGKVGCHEREESGNTDAQEGSAPLTLIGQGQEEALRCVNTGPAHGLPTRAWRTAAGDTTRPGGVPVRVGIFIGEPHGTPPKRTAMWANFPTNVAGALARHSSLQGGEAGAMEPAVTQQVDQSLCAEHSPSHALPPYCLSGWSHPSDRPPTFAASPLCAHQPHSGPAPGCPTLSSRLWSGAPEGAVRWLRPTKSPVRSISLRKSPGNMSTPYHLGGERMSMSDETGWRGVLAPPPARRRFASSPHYSF